MSLQPNVLTFLPPDWGMLRKSRCVSLDFSLNNNKKKRERCCFEMSRWYFSTMTGRTKSQREGI